MCALASSCICLRRKWMLGAKSRSCRQSEALGFSVRGLSKCQFSSRKIQYRGPGAHFLAVADPTLKCDDPPLGQEIGTSSFHEAYQQLRNAKLEHERECFVPTFAVNEERGNFLNNGVSNPASKFVELGFEKSPEERV